MTSFRGNKLTHSTRSLTSPTHHRGPSHIYMRIYDILQPYPLVHRHIVTHHRIITLVACFALTHIDIQQSSWIPQASSKLYRAYFKFSMTLLRSELRPSEFASEQPRNSLRMPHRHLDHVYKEHIDVEQQKKKRSLLPQTALVIQFVDLNFDLGLDNEHDIMYSTCLSFTFL